MSGRFWAVAFAASSPFWISCALVLDLDAEGEGGGQGGDGRPEPAGPSGSTGPGPMGPKGASASTGPGPGPACEGHAIFSGQQYLTMSDGHALDRDDHLGIVARLQSTASADGIAGDGTILSRISPSDAKGYAFVLVEPVDDGTVYPELRVFVEGALCVCTSSTPLAPGAWTTVLAGYARGPGADAEVWVDGSAVCAVDCGDSKLATFDWPVVIGAAGDGASGFLKGALSELTVRDWQRGASLNPGCSGSGVHLSLSFETAVGQSFKADCPNEDLTLGEGVEVASDDPQVVTCP